MSNAISRRVFLKCAGAATVAVGAASMLGGCSLIDDAIDDALNGMMDKNNVAGVTHNRVGVTWNMAAINHASGTVDGEWKKGPIDTVTAAIDISSLSSQEYDLKAENIELKVDGVKATVQNYNDVQVADKKDLLLGQNGVVHIGAGDLESRSVSGYVVFKLNNEPKPESWSKLELTIKFGPGTFSFTATPKKDHPDEAEIKANR